MLGNAYIWPAREALQLSSSWRASPAAGREEGVFSNSCVDKVRTPIVYRQYLGKITPASTPNIFENDDDSDDNDDNNYDDDYDDDDMMMLILILRRC